MTKHATLYYKLTPPQGGEPVSACRPCMESAVANGWQLGKYSSDPVCTWCKKAAADKEAEKQRARAETKAGPTGRRR